MVRIWKKNWTQIFSIWFWLLEIGYCCVSYGLRLGTSLKPNGALYEFIRHDFTSIDEVDFRNYRYVLGQGKFCLKFLNSMCVSVASVLIAAAIGTRHWDIIVSLWIPGKLETFWFGFIVFNNRLFPLTLIVPQYELAVKFTMQSILFRLVLLYSMDKFHSTHLW